MQVAKETVTPKKAMEWLKRNVANRPLSSSVVSNYSTAMQDGAWRLNGDTIRFNGNGDLIDGQHRLNACVQAGKPFETYVVRGLEHDAFDTIDQGRKRSIGDVFARRNFKHYVALAKAVRCLYRYGGSGRKTELLRPDIANKLIDDNPGLQDSVADCYEYGLQKLMSAGLAGYLVYATRLSSTHVSASFWKSIGSGEGLKKDMPEYWLRERLISNRGSTAKLHSDVVCALCVKAWNLAKAAKPCKTLKFDVAREEMPTIQ